MLCTDPIDTKSLDWGGLRNFEDYNIVAGGSIDFFLRTGSKYTIPGTDIHKSRLEITNKNQISTNHGPILFSVAMIQVRKFEFGLTIHLYYVVDEKRMDMDIENYIGHPFNGTIKGPFHYNPGYRDTVHVRVAVTAGGFEIFVNTRLVTTVPEVLADAPLQITHGRWDVSSKTFKGTPLNIRITGS